MKYIWPSVVLIWMITSYSSWKSKIQYLKVLHYMRPVKKRDLSYRNVTLSENRVHLRTLGQGSFCMTNCISAPWRGGGQPVALLRCY